MGLAVGFVDQAEQVVIVNVLDLVGEDHEFAIDLIEFAALEMIAELIAAQAEGVASGWMPASCAKALRPMMALFGCTGISVISSSIWLVGYRCSLAMPVWYG